MLEPTPVLVADIGGTNLRFALACDKGKTGSLEKIKYYQSSQFSGIQEAVELYLQDTGIDPRHYRAVLAVCAPVTSGMIDIPKLSWKFSANELKKRFSFPELSICNDLQAQAFSLGRLEPEQVAPLLPAEIRPGARLVISAGTGFGGAWSIPGAGVFGGEPGQVLFSPGSEREDQLSSYWCRKMGRLRLEDLLSGAGLVRIYQFLASGNETETGKRSENHPPSAPEIVHQSRESMSDPVFRESVMLFQAIYARAAAQVALHLPPGGGLYISGNIALQFEVKEWERALQPFFRSKKPEFCALQEIPVYRICDRDVALVGAALFQ